MTANKVSNKALVGAINTAVGAFELVYSDHPPLVKGVLIGVLVATLYLEHVNPRFSLNLPTPRYLLLLAALIAVSTVEMGLATVVTRGVDARDPLTLGDALHMGIAYAVIVGLPVSVVTLARLRGRVLLSGRLSQYTTGCAVQVVASLLILPVALSAPDERLIVTTWAAVLGPVWLVCAFLMSAADRLRIPLAIFVPLVPLALYVQNLQFARIARWLARDGREEGSVDGAAPTGDEDGWERTRLTVPLRLNEADPAFGERFEQIVREHLERAARDGWEPDGPTDRRALLGTDELDAARGLTVQSVRIPVRRRLRG